MLLSDDGVVEDIESCEQCGCAVAFVVMRRAGGVWLHRQSWLSAVERLDLSLLVD